MWLNKESLNRELHAMVVLHQENKSRIDKVEKEIEGLTYRISALEKSAMNSPSSDTKQRLDALELWKAQIHTLAVGQTPHGKPTLTKFGKQMFGGTSPRNNPK